MKTFVSAWLLSLLFLAGCSQILSLVKTPSLIASPEASPAASKPAESGETPVTEKPTSQATAELAEASTEAVVDQAQVLKVWLPPQFDPNSGTPAGEVLKGRLQVFAAEHPGLQIDVRIKALDGPGGLLDSLISASAAAPQALPDLVALSRPLLEKAALKGLVFPLNGLTKVLNQEDWYGYAKELAYLQQSPFGLPFAGDALIFVYQPSDVIEAPQTWNRLMEYPGMLAFSAADPEALFTLAQYQAAGGKIQDDQGRPSLDAETLTKVLTLYINAVQVGRVSDRLSQLETQEQVWRAFQEGQFSMAVSWTSLFLSAKDTAAILIPTPGGNAFTLATGWSWAIANPQAENRNLSADLADYLVESDFLARWSEAGGFLPPRPSALELWKTDRLQSLLSDLSDSAHLIPPGDILSSLGPVLQQSVLQVLRQEKIPISAAQAAVESLKNP